MFTSTDSLTRRFIYFYGDIHSYYVFLRWL